MILLCQIPTGVSKHASSGFLSRPGGRGGRRWEGPLWAGLLCRLFFPPVHSLQGGTVAARSFQNDVYRCSRLGKEFSQFLFTCVWPRSRWLEELQALRSDQWRATGPWSCVSSAAVAPGPRGAVGTPVSGSPRSHS